MSKVESPRKIIDKVIRNDHQKSFYKLLRNKDDVVMPSADVLLRSICSHRAEGCLNTLIDEDVPFEGGLYPLHIASQSLWHYAVDAYLLHGASTDVPSNDPPNFPLSLALNALRNNTCASEWNPNISIFKLLYIFCLPELKEPLETVKLLASNTEQLDTISSRFVLQGEVVQLAALLLVAWDKLVQPFSDQGIQGCPIAQLILNQLRLQENRTSQTLDTLIHIHFLKNAWTVLEILDIARDTIEEFRLSELDIASHLVPVHVASNLWHKHKIYLEPEDRFADDVKCLRPQLTPKQKAWLSRSIDKGIRSVSTFPTLTGRHTAGGAPISCSFHTSSSSLNLVKPCKSQVSEACHKPGAGFSDFLRSSGLRIPRLLLALKRM